MRMRDTHFACTCMFTHRGSRVVMEDAGTSKATSKLTDDATVQKQNVIGVLGKLSDSQFCCGGVLSSPDAVCIVLLPPDLELELAKKQGTGTMTGGKCVRFPATDQTLLRHLIEVCTLASYGVGKEVVTDTSYRNALQLEPDRFACTFQLCDTPVLSEIQQFLVPQARGMRAQLYMLNVYGPGGHFKTHVDTPRGLEMFGSLVVCLPTQFTGGVLSVRHHGKETRFDWSSCVENPSRKLQWAAFFGDVEHEVLPVIDGYRVTLTYNLYHEKSETQQDSIKISPFYEELKAALSSEHFLSQGGVLGFACRHSYVLTDLNGVETAPFLLKGADYNIYMSAKSLGLAVCLKPVLSDMIENCEYQSRYLLSSFKEEVDETKTDFDEFGVKQKDVVRSLFKEDPQGVNEITWCWNDYRFTRAATYVAMGNMPFRDHFYQAAVILIAVPEWSEESGSRIAEQGGG